MTSYVQSDWIKNSFHRSELRLSVTVAMRLQRTYLQLNNSNRNDVISITTLVFNINYLFFVHGKL